MDADKLLFTWNDFSIYGKGNDTYTLWYRGAEVNERTIPQEFKPYSAEWIGTLIIWLTNEGTLEGVPEAIGDILFALGTDLLSHYDMLTWWTCKGCGRKTFAVPDDDLVCVWCGTVPDADQDIS